jgi:hypothetical protein
MQKSWNGTSQQQREHEQAQSTAHPGHRDASPVLRTYFHVKRASHSRRLWSVDVNIRQFFKCRDKPVISFTTMLSKSAIVLALAGAASAFSPATPALSGLSHRASVSSLPGKFLRQRLAGPAPHPDRDCMCLEAGGQQRRAGCAPSCGRRMGKAILCAGNWRHQCLW